jgi:drug/metabolite transporter (DMT)-like permease
LGLSWTSFFDGFEIALGHAHLELNLWTSSLILFVAIGPSLIAYRCWGLGVSGAGPTAAAFFANFIPLFTALLSAAMLSRAATVFHWICVCFIAAVVSGVSSSKGRSLQS